MSILCVAIQHRVLEIKHSYERWKDTLCGAVLLSTDVVDVDAGGALRNKILDGQFSRKQSVCRSVQT